MVYLRHSSLQQVKQNKESQRLQYALADKAKALGFHHVEIIVVNRPGIFGDSKS